MEIMQLFFNFIRATFNMLNTYTFLGAPLGSLIITFSIVGMVISVFWKGASA